MNVLIACHCKHTHMPVYLAGDIVDNNAFWLKVFKETAFSKFIEKTYKIALGSIMESDDDAGDD